MNIRNFGLLGLSVLAAAAVFLLIFLLATSPETPVLLPGEPRDARALDVDKAAPPPASLAASDPVDSSPAPAHLPAPRDGPCAIEVRIRGSGCRDRIRVELRRVRLRIPGLGSRWEARPGETVILRLEPGASR